MKTKIIRTSTVPGSIDTFCQDLLRELQEGEGYEVVANVDGDVDVTSASCQKSLVNPI